MKNILFSISLFSFIVVWAACSKDDNDNGTADITFRLTDAPAAYDAVYVDIKEVQVQNESNGWITLPIARQGVYNLLNFRNGLDTLLCHATLPAGRVNQIRLVLNSNNSVVVNGVNYPLNTPSAEESGLKLNLNTAFEANGSYMIWIDFDAGASIVRQGNGGYRLKPVIRAYSNETNGKISGTVLPLTAGAIVYATNGTDTYTAIPDNNGNFVIGGMASGTYTITIDAAAGSGFNDKVITNVNVQFGQITSLGAISL